MNKITNEQFTTLIKLQSTLPVTQPKCVQETTVENIVEAQRLCKELEFELKEIQALLNETEEAFYYKDMNTAVNKIAEYTHRAKEIKQDAFLLENYIAGSIIKLIGATEVSSFTLTATNEEIQRVIDKNFELYPVMSIGFKDGLYALLFGEDEESIDIEPFIFAKGEEKDYEDLQKFIEGFLDLEDFPE